MNILMSSSRSCIPLFKPGRDSYCTCPPKYAINPYKGCEFSCYYCYGRRWFKRFGLIEKSGLVKARPKKDLPENLEKFMEKKKRLPYPVLLSSITDAYQPLEEKEKITRNVLKILRKHNSRVMIQTKGEIVRRDYDLLNENSVVSVSISTLEDEKSKMIEPKAPNPWKRIDALDYLSRKNVITTLFLDPIIPYFNDEKREVEEVVKNAKEAGVCHVTSGVLRITPDIWQVLRKHLPQDVTEKIEMIYFKQPCFRAGYYYAPPVVIWEEMKKVALIAKKHELSFGGCRTGFQKLNTSVCDGSAYLSRFIKKRENENRKMDRKG
jgi:DNA repair photolyase